MALLPILEFPDSRLRKVAKLITVFDEALKRLADDLLETMYDAPGIGLAATQVNIHKRIVTVDVSDEQDAPLILINPTFEVVDAELHEMQEGCLSVPGFYEIVKRPELIDVTFQNLQGDTQTIRAQGLMAVCIQHEIDHLDGKLFVDYISTLKRDRIRKKLEKQHRLDN